MSNYQLTSAEIAAVYEKWLDSLDGDFFNPSVSEFDGSDYNLHSVAVSADEAAEDLYDQLLEEALRAKIAKLESLDKAARPSRRRGSQERYPAGHPKGGQFKPKGRGGSGSAAKKAGKSKARAQRRSEPDVGHGPKGLAAKQRLRRISRDRKNKEGKRDKRLGGGQKQITLRRPDGKPFSSQDKSQFGEVMEALVLKKVGPRIARKIGGGRLRHSAAGKSKRGKKQNTATVDIYNDKWGVESKAVTDLADGGNPKVTMKSTQATEKFAWARRNQREIYIVAPRIEQRPDGTPTGRVFVHGYVMQRGGAINRRVKATPVIAEFRFTWAEYDAIAADLKVSKVAADRRSALRSEFFKAEEEDFKYVTEDREPEPGDLMMQWNGKDLLFWWNV